MRRTLAWILVFLLVLTLLFSGVMILLLTWGYQINETDQWPELLRFVAMILLPVAPLLLWYSRGENNKDNE